MARHLSRCGLDRRVGVWGQCLSQHCFDIGLGDGAVAEQARLPGVGEVDHGAFQTRRAGAIVEDQREVFGRVLPLAEKTGFHVFGGGR